MSFQSAGSPDLRTKFPFVDHLVDRGAVRPVIVLRLIIGLALVLVGTPTFAAPAIRAGAFTSVCSRLLTLNPAFTPRANQYTVRVQSRRVAQQCSNTCALAALVSQLENYHQTSFSFDYVNLSLMQAAMDSAIAGTQPPEFPDPNVGLMWFHLGTFKSGFEMLRNVGGIVPEADFKFPQAVWSEVSQKVASAGATTNGAPQLPMEYVSRHLGWSVYLFTATETRANATELFRNLVASDLDPIRAGLRSGVDPRRTTDHFLSGLTVVEHQIQSLLNASRENLSVDHVIQTIKYKLDAGVSVMFGYFNPNARTKKARPVLRASADPLAEATAFREAFLKTGVGFAHAVVIEGYLPGIDGQPEWFLIKDSQGTEYGEGGYIHMHRSFIGVYGVTIAYFRP